MFAPSRFARTGLSLLVSLSLACSLAAQDTVFQAFGNTTGTPFDFRAPANERIHAVHARTGAWIDALALEFGTRQVFGTTTMTSWVGSTTGGSPTSYTHSPAIMPQTIQMFLASGFISQIVIDFGTPFPLVWGGSHAGETSHTFTIPSGEELVGLHGTATTSLIGSLGIVTRPRLGNDYDFSSGGSFGCGPSGGLGVRFQPGHDDVHLSGSPVLELVNVPSVALASALILGASTSSWNGIRLPLNVGESNGRYCYLLVSMDVLVPVVPDPSGIASQTLPVPALPALVGQWFYISGFSLHPSFNANGVIAADRIDCQIGAV